MADSFNKKEREKKRRKRKKEKAERKKLKKEEGVKPEEFMYVDENGNLVAEKPEPGVKEEIELEDILISTPKKEDLGEEDPIRKGKIKFFDHDRGFGFIRDSDNGSDVFVHIEHLEQEVNENDKVEFEMGSGPKGPMAVKVKKV